jgi:hypothetical protein
MPELSFQVESVDVDAKAISPLLVFKLRVENADSAQLIQNVALRCQLQIESTRRRYSPEEQTRLKDLFGESDRWNQTLRAMLWTHASAIVPPFTGATIADLPVPCTFDFNVAATKYFAGLADGEIPLEFLFSGSVFYRDDAAELQVTQIPWDKEAKFRLPVQTWQRMIDIYYPNSAWLNLHRDTYDRLCEFKVQHGLPTWEHAIERLLDSADRTGAAANATHRGKAANGSAPQPIVLRR